MLLGNKPGPSGGSGGDLVCVQTFFVSKSAQISPHIKCSHVQVPWMSCTIKTTIVNNCKTFWWSRQFIEHKEARIVACIWVVLWSSKIFITGSWKILYVARTSVTSFWVTPHVPKFFQKAKTSCHRSWHHLWKTHKAFVEDPQGCDVILWKTHKAVTSFVEDPQGCYVICGRPTRLWRHLWKTHKAFVEDPKGICGVPTRRLWKTHNTVV